MRATTPPALPPRHRVALVAGRVHIGDDPWCACPICPTTYDTATFTACPRCVHEAQHAERAKWAAIRLTYAADAGPSIH